MRELYVVQTSDI